MYLKLFAEKGNRNMGQYPRVRDGIKRRSFFNGKSSNYVLRDYAVKMGKWTCQRGKNCQSNILGKGAEIESNVQTEGKGFGRSMDNSSLVARRKAK